jgi:chemotaxis protein MotB
MYNNKLLYLTILSAALGGCVSQGRYDAAVSDASKARAQLIEQRSAAEKQRLADRRALSELESELATERIRYETATKNAAELLQTKDALAVTVEDFRQRMNELRRAQAAADSRASLFREVALRLKRMIDAGDLRIALRSGRMVLMLPNDVLFDSGKTEIKARGKEALAQVAAVLSSMPERRFQVAGHTDDQPIRFSGFTSNWQLSGERALRVVEFLVKSGMQAGALSTAGYGEHDPFVANDGADGRSQNRRIEITLQPNIDESITIPDVN